MAKLTDEEVQTMLAQLKEHFRQPVMPVSAYCDAFRKWRDAVSAASKREPNNQTYLGMLHRIYEAQLDILKSNLLYRLLYLGEDLRTEMCPIHKGQWSGCVGPDDDCPHCMAGGNVTGWVAPKVELKRTQSMQTAFNALYGPSPPVFVKLKVVTQEEAKSPYLKCDYPLKSTWKFEAIGEIWEILDVTKNWVLLSTLKGGQSDCPVALYVNRINGTFVVDRDGRQQLSEHWHEDAIGFIETFFNRHGLPKWP